MKSRTVFGVDILLVLAVLGLTAIGIAFIYSSGVTSAGLSASREYVRQMIWASIGLSIMVSLIFVNYAKLKNIAPVLYGISILLLIITLLFGQVVNGAKSWLGIFSFGIQPSEFAKAATILMLAGYLSKNEKRLDSIRHFLIAIGILLLPIFLILLQPDMGTALVYIPIFIVIAFAAGFPTRYIVFILLTGFFFLFLAFLPAWGLYLADKEYVIVSLFSNWTFLIITMLGLAFITIIAFWGFKVFKKIYYYWIMYGGSILLLAFLSAEGARLFLKDYQLMRLIVFINPDIDPRGAGWNIIQSVTAVGSGGFLGKGFLKGTQSHYRFLPQQSTDFIFSIIAEEWGFLGGLLVFTLYAVIIYRIVAIALTIKDSFAQYICAGILAMLCFHFFINVGMAMGIMPIAGIPLIFLSYGGSSLWTGMISAGVVLSIYSNRYRYS